ncbi:hypothetical protein ACP275_07G004800 [Erythranthe tilingii]
MMRVEVILGVVFVVVVVLGCLKNGEAVGVGLSDNFYAESCPEVESIVRAGVQSASLTDPTTPAALLRLMFHDCQVQGCDASILVNADGVITKSSEMGSTKNFGIRKRELISLVKSAVEAVCPRRISCADILVMAAREAVAFSGGPRIIRLPLGRRDSINPPNAGLADASLPHADIGLDSTLQLFAKKGMTIEESVAILGAHTLGVTHCINLQSRLYSTRKSNATNQNPAFELSLKTRCPQLAGPTASKISFMQNDLTSVIFDNEYFVNSMRGRGLLNVDSDMAVDSRTRPFVEKFAEDQGAFFRAFSSAFVKLSSYGVLTGNRGVVRRSCGALD